MEKADPLTTLYLRGVPAELVREAKARAARRGSTLTTLITEALARSLDADGESQNPFEADLRDSMKWYAQNRARLLRRYRNEYVTIVERAVIDHDEDFESLATRAFRRVGFRSIFMPRVTEGLERVRVRSPRRRSS